ncbi:MAG: D-glycerate dehydrogenase [Actinobacteria bacterium]|nr:D-glycerate dehydrogenase [Actinomycetota bacterium]PLS84510.1 MAG: D-glycerate dehydrogenase [Actinomycetota bacterium]
MPGKVLVTREIPEAGLRVLKEAGFDVTVLSEAPPARDGLLEAARGAKGVLSTVTETVDGEFMDVAGGGLKVVANMAVGYDNVDVGAAQERGVVVTNTPGVLDETTADVAFMLLLAAARRLGEAERTLRAGRWEWWGPKLFMGPDVWGKRIGIVGLGRIGQAVARRARGFGMEIYYHNRSRKEEAERELGARWMELDELLETVDFVSVHTPLTEETRHLIGAEELGKMKPRAVLVNTSRGPVVDEAALAEALEAGSIFAAGLDVYEEEPKVHPKLLERENVVLAPHIGSGSIETRDRMAVLAAENIRAVLRGEPPKNPVEQ